MKISILCFSLNGYVTGQRLAWGLQKQNHEVYLAGKSKYIPDSISIGHTEWTGQQFLHADAIIFVCACGIAVRSIAPFVKSKKTDPAVLVVDECGNYVISLLSGHLGGANELTEIVAELLGALPVITTATDLRNRFAVDVFVKKNECGIFPMKAAKECSAALLAGESVGFYSDYEWDGMLPDGLSPCHQRQPKNWESSRLKTNSEKLAERAACCEEQAEAKKQPQIGIAVSIDSKCRPFPVTVQIIPKIVSIGIGCRKGKDAGAIEQAVRKCLEENQISQEALRNIASIDLKKEEPGILALAKKWNLPFLTYSENELMEVNGAFSVSDFVRSVTGVDNVCERSAVLASAQGQLIQKKIGKDGVTVALAVKDWRVRFE